MDTSINSCWFYILNSTGDYEISNTTINCKNTTFNVSDEESFTLFLYVNDSYNNINFTEVSFFVSTTKPSVVLDYPTPLQYLNNATNVYFNFTSTDSDGLDTCELWGNWTGTWNKNYTWISPTNSIMNWTTLNLSEGRYKWNIWCNDTTGNENWGFNNLTFEIDLTNPQLIYNSPKGNIVDLDITLDFDVNESNIDYCYYDLFLSDNSIYDSNHIIPNCNDTLKTKTNVKYNFSLPSYRLWMINLTVIDKAGNFKTINSTFTTIPLTTIINKDKGSSSILFVKVIALVLPDEFRLLSKLERAIVYKIFYGRFQNIPKYSLSDGDLSEIKDELNSYSIVLTLDEISLLVNQYNKNLTESVEIKKDDVKKYNLIESKNKHSGEKFAVNPKTLEPFFLVFSKNSVFKYLVRSNRKLTDVRLIRAEYGLSIEKISNTTINIKFKPPTYPTGYNFKIISGVANYVSETGESVYQNINIRVIIVSKKLIISLIILFILVMFFFFYYKKGFLKKQTFKLFKK